MTPDKTALRILFDTHWNSGGWKTHFETSPDDFAYAKAKGLMFDPVSRTHDELIHEIASITQEISKEAVADAFLASLSSRTLATRSALGSFAVVRHLIPHKKVPYESRCGICGEYLISQAHDLNVLNFERHKWGGVRHAQPTYALFDLQQFLKDSRDQPTTEDVAIFLNLVQLIEAAPANTTAAALEKHISSALKSNKSERDILIGILGVCGILGTIAHPGFKDSHVRYCDRELPDRHFIDMPYPVCWWRRPDGINNAAVQFWFGHRIH